MEVGGYRAAEFCGVGFIVVHAGAQVVIVKIDIYISRWSIKRTTCGIG
jgi:hypothetical protein